MGYRPELILKITDSIITNHTTKLTRETVLSFLNPFFKSLVVSLSLSLSRAIVSAHVRINLYNRTLRSIVPKTFVLSIGLATK